MLSFIFSFVCVVIVALVAMCVRSSKKVSDLRVSVKTLNETLNGLRVDYDNLDRTTDMKIEGLLTEVYLLRGFSPSFIVQDVNGDILGGFDTLLDVCEKYDHSVNVYDTEKETWVSENVIANVRAYVMKNENTTKNVIVEVAPKVETPKKVNEGAKVETEKKEKAKTVATDNKKNETNKEVKKETAKETNKKVSKGVSNKYGFEFVPDTNPKYEGLLIPVLPSQGNMSDEEYKKVKSAHNNLIYKVRTAWTSGKGQIGVNNANETASKVETKETPKETNKETKKDNKKETKKEITTKEETAKEVATDNKKEDNKTTAQKKNEEIKKAKESAKKNETTKVENKEDHSVSASDKKDMKRQSECIKRSMNNAGIDMIDLEPITLKIENITTEIAGVKLSDEGNLMIFTRGNSGKARPFDLDTIIEKRNDNRVMNVEILKTIGKQVNEVIAESNRKKGVRKTA